MAVLDSKPQGSRTEFSILLHHLENTSVKTEGTCILFEYKIKVPGKLHSLYNPYFKNRKY